jgi:hypothetical protein
LGIGDWGIGPIPQTPIPNPHYNELYKDYNNDKILECKNLFLNYLIVDLKEWYNRILTKNYLETKIDNYFEKDIFLNCFYLLAIIGLICEIIILYNYNKRYIIRYNSISHLSLMIIINKLNFNKIEELYDFLKKVSYNKLG